MTTAERLFDPSSAFDHPVTLWITVGVAVVIVVAFLVTGLLSALGKIDAPLRAELIARCTTWAWLAPLMIAPVLLGGAGVILGVALLSLFCYAEYARATGLFRERAMSACVVLSILVITFSIVDHWYAFFMALFPLSTAVILGVALLADRPKGYIQRVALAVLAVALFGTGLGHLSYLANDALFRPILLTLLASVALNDVAAYVFGKIFGKRKLCPETSPNKTVAGAVGALLTTTVFVAFVMRQIFTSPELARWDRLLVLGAIVSVVGQLGDLMLSSVKRDLGVKDVGAVLPGHGGLLDRFDSLLLIGPAVFHYVGYFRGVGWFQATRILTGE